MDIKYSDAEKIAQQIVDVMKSKEIDNADALIGWLTKDTTSAPVVSIFKDEDRFSEAVDSFDKSEICKSSLLGLKARMASSRRKLLARLTTSVAAAIIAVSMIVWSGVFNDYKPINVEHSRIIGKIASINVDAPTLIMDNGKDVNLNNISDDIEGSNFIKDEDSKIKYIKPTNAEIITKFNTLIVPSKFTYSVELSDGTKVMLNANSKLIYPVNFDKNKREVALEGEAFFDVSKSDTPFVVNTGGVNIRVYGTKFNVNSYDQNSVETVLLSGRVGVTINSRLDILEQILEPNQLVNTDFVNGSYELRSVDATAYISWIDGKIKSYDSTLGDLIKKLSYWYGVDFEFENQNKWDIPLTASFSQKQSIEKVISAVEYAAKVKIEKKKGGYIVH